MNDREYKIKVLHAHREGIISKDETKLLFEAGIPVPIVAWAGGKEEARILELKQKIFSDLIPVSTWAK